jgi:hypothetical protein
MTRLPALLLAAAVALTACAKPTLDEDIADLRAKNAAGEYQTVVDQAPVVLQRAKAEGAEPFKQWSIEKARLEATAHLGQGAETVAALGQLSKDYADNVTPELYSQMAGFVADSGDLLAAVDVLEAGRKCFPEMGDKFQPQIEYVKQKATETADDATIEKLKALGYL